MTIIFLNGILEKLAWFGLCSTSGACTWRLHLGVLRRFANISRCWACLLSSAFCFSGRLLAPRCKHMAIWFSQYLILTGLPFQFLGSTFILVVCIYWERNKLIGIRGLSMMGKDTFGIYLAHLVPLYLLLEAWKALELPVGPVESLAPALITWLFCLWLVRLSRIGRWRITGRLLFGGR